MIIGASHVRLDGTFGEVSNPGIAGLEPRYELRGGPKTPGDGGRTRSADAPGEPLAADLTSCEALVALVRGAEEGNVAAVAEARDLVQSGKLDTPEASMRAAVVILATGA